MTEELDSPTLRIGVANRSVSVFLDDHVVYPCEVILYCGYSYESSLIAETAGIMIPAVLLFAWILFLLSAFIWNASLGKILMSLPVFAFTAFFQMCSILGKAEFFSKTGKASLT